MTYDIAHQFFNWISNHPHLAGVAIFLIACSESVVIVGILVPGVALMTVIGTLIGSGHINMYSAFLWAICGAIMGDGISYLIGHHYKDDLRKLWFFQRYPNLLTRCEAFFVKHGSKSVAFGRFVGPVRAMIPCLAGMMNMSPARFFFANIISAIVWAPAYTLPGIVLGSSFHNMPPGSGKRLAFLIFIVLIICWMLRYILLLAYEGLFKLSHAMMNSILQFLNTSTTEKFPKLLPTTKKAILLDLALSTTILAVLSIIMAFSIHNHGIATVLNAYVKLLITDSSGITLQKIAQIGITPFLLWPYLATIASILCYISYQRQWWTLLHVSILNIAGEILLQIFPSLQNEIMHCWLLLGSWQLLLLASTKRIRVNYVRCSYLIVIFVMLYSLILGRNWLANEILTLLIAAALLKLIFFLYQHKNEFKLPSSFIIYCSSGILLVASVVTYYIHIPISYLPTLPTAYQSMTQQDWLRSNTDDELLPIARRGILKNPAPLLNVQWLGNIDVIRNVLRGTNWYMLPQFSWNSALRLLESPVQPTLMPRLPQFHDDQQAPASFVKILKDKQLLFLQLWPSTVVIKNQMVWLGTVEYGETKRLFTFANTLRHKRDSSYNAAAQVFYRLLQEHHDLVHAQIKLITTPNILQPSSNKHNINVDPRQTTVVKVYFR